MTRVPVSCLIRLACLIWLAGACLFFVAAPRIAHGETWHTLQTKYLVLQYQDPADLQKFDKQIDFNEPSGFSGFFSSGSPSGKKLTEKLSKKLDALFEKVQLILDMRKPIQVKIRIYPHETALQDAYFKIYKKRRNLRAWYIFEYNTIYVNVQDLYAGMLAHECAHAIVDNYLAVRPPRATAEILARYVDKHLNADAKTY